jgi:hypothetical protein
MILYMLKNVAFPLTNSQISEFVISKGYTSYFKVQQSISELLETAFIDQEATHNRTLYHLTEEGAAALDVCQDDIAPGVRMDIDIYLRDKMSVLQNDASIKSTYEELEDGTYVVHCHVIEHGEPLIALDLSAPTKSSAETIATNWYHKNEEIYGFVMSHLL